MPLWFSVAVQNDVITSCVMVRELFSIQVFSINFGMGKVLVMAVKQNIERVKTNTRILVHQNNTDRNADTHACIAPCKEDIIENCTNNS